MLLDYILEIDTHADFLVTIQVLEDGTPKDLTGHTVRAMAREANEFSLPSGVVEFDADITNAESGEITIGLGDEITAEFTPTRKSQVTWPLWDCIVEETGNNFKTKVAKGSARIWDTQTYDD